MSCVCDYENGTREFPDNISCLAKDGFGAQLPKKVKGLGGRTALMSKPVVTVTAFTLTAENTAIFMEWYVEELNYGTRDFLIDIPIWGIRRKWTATMMNEPSEQLLNGNAREVVLKLKIHDDLSQVISENSFCEGC